MSDTDRSPDPAFDQVIADLEAKGEVEEAAAVRDYRQCFLKSVKEGTNSIYDRDGKRIGPLPGPVIDESMDNMSEEDEMDLIDKEADEREARCNE